VISSDLPDNRKPVIIPPFKPGGDLNNIIYMIFFAVISNFSIFAVPK
jgi:hypothetical protein